MVTGALGLVGASATALMAALTARGRGMGKILGYAVLLSLFTSAQVRAAPSTSAEEVIRAATAQVVERFESDPELTEDPDRLYEMVQDIVLPHFDFERTSRRVLGKAWRRASQEQRQRFVTEFRTLLVKTYAIALASYGHEEIVYGPPRTRSEKEMSVRTEIASASGGGPGIPITYELHLTGNDWKVYDVVIDGVSLSLTYRNDFRSRVRREGIDALISHMIAHNRGTR